MPAVFLTTTPRSATLDELSDTLHLFSFEQVSAEVGKERIVSQRRSCGRLAEQDCRDLHARNDGPSNVVTFGEKSPTRVTGTNTETNEPERAFIPTSSVVSFAKQGSAPSSIFTQPVGNTSSGLSVGARVGIGLGIVGTALVVILAFIIVTRRRRRFNRQRKRTTSSYILSKMSKKSQLSQRSRGSTITLQNPVALSNEKSQVPAIPNPTYQAVNAHESHEFGVGSDGSIQIVTKGLPPQQNREGISAGSPC